MADFNNWPLISLGTSTSTGTKITSDWLFEFTQAYCAAKGIHDQGTREGANKRGNSSRLTQSFHFFMFEPIFSPVNALNQPI